MLFALLAVWRCFKFNKIRMVEFNLFSERTYIERRRILKENMGSGLLLILGNDEASINFKDNWYPFRQDSTFLYYFGLNVSGLAAIIDIDKDEEIIFGEELSIDDIVWNGPQPTLEALAERVGVHKVLSLSGVKDIISNSASLHYLPPYRPEHLLKLSAWTGQHTDLLSHNFSVSFVQAVAAQRSIKSTEEVQELDQAASFSAAMHLHVMKTARAGMKEYELVGEAYHSVARNGSRLAFPAIMTTRGHILHNHYHGNVLREGDMVLFDGGAESNKHYAGDLTRTFPVGPSFTNKQREIYQVVLEAHEESIAALRPGVLFRDVHLLACRKLVDGLKALGLMKGDSEEAVNAGAHTLFFQCGLGHMMGLDVHDMENLGEEYIGYTPELTKSKEFGLKSLRLGKALEAGFVLTVEPGIYFIPELIEMRRKNPAFNNFVNFTLLDSYKDFGGIRVEDDFLITENGSKQLGTSLPRTVKEIESVRQSSLNPLVV